MRQKRILKNKFTAIAVSVVALQVFAGSVHLLFTGDVRANVYFLNSQIVLVFLSFCIWVLLRGRTARMLSLSLVVYNVIGLIMEAAAMVGFKSIVLTLNSFFYSQMLFIILAGVLCLTGSIAINGIRRRRSAKSSNVYKLLPSGGSLKKRNIKN